MEINTNQSMQVTQTCQLQLT